MYSVLSKRLIVEKFRKGFIIFLLDEILLIVYYLLLIAKVNAPVYLILQETQGFLFDSIVDCVFLRQGS